MGQRDRGEEEDTDEVADPWSHDHMVDIYAFRGAELYQDLQG